MEGEHSQLAIPSPHIVWVSCAHLSLVLLRGVASSLVLPGPLGFHTWDSILVLAQVPTERGL